MYVSSHVHAYEHTSTVRRIDWDEHCWISRSFVYPFISYSLHYGYNRKSNYPMNRDPKAFRRRNENKPVLVIHLLLSLLTRHKHSSFRGLFGLIHLFSLSQLFIELRLLLLLAQFLGWFSGYCISRLLWGLLLIVLLSVRGGGSQILGIL